VQPALILHPLCRLEHRGVCWLHSAAQQDFQAAQHFPDGVLQLAVAKGAYRLSLLVRTAPSVRFVHIQDLVGMQRRTREAFLNGTV
jgi:hypothetical protein